MTTTEAAALLGVTRAWLWRIIKSGALTAAKRGRDYWIDEAEVERYQAQRRKAGRPKSRVAG